MHKIMLAAVLLLSMAVQAQDKIVKELKKEAARSISKNPADTSNKNWKTGGIFNINVAQGSLSNWAAGGDKFSLAINSNLNLNAHYKKDRRYWDNLLNLNLGFMNTTSLGTRKNDDRIDFLTKYGHQVSPKWNLGLLFNFRSQMLKGFTYDSDTTKTLTSKFMAPGYFLVSPGLEFKPDDHFSAFVSPVTARLTVVADDTLSAHGAYGVDTLKHFKTEVGAFASLIYNKAFNKVFSYNGRLDLYSNYLHNPQNVDLFFTNLLAMKIGKAFAVTYNLDLIYDDDVRLFGPEKKSPALQVKSIFGVGIMYKFL